MSQINRPPVGLQSLLGSKNFGENPSNLAQQVLPVTDLFSFWGSQVLKLYKAEGVSAGVGSLIELQVPDGKTWGILSAVFTCNVRPTGDDCRFAIAIDETATGSEWFDVAAFMPSTNVADTTPQSVVWNPPNIFWLPPGYTVRGTIDSTDAAASRTFAIDVVTYELDV